MLGKSYITRLLISRELALPLRVIFVDMNAYFATCEQHLDPRLLGKPIGVAPVLGTDHTCVIAASYEAKALGVKTGMGVDEAKLLCPKIRIVQARPIEYVKLHHQIIEAVESCIHVTRVWSIDEMACNLPGDEQPRPRAEKIARQIKHALRERIGPAMKCSIGIAPNRLLAKMAADMKKPDGLTIIEQHDLPQILFPLKLQDVPGISHRMEARLNRVGITTMEQLCAAPQQKFYDGWQSVVGRYFWHWLNGEDVPDVPTQKGSVGHSHVLPPDYRSDAGARAVMIRLIARASERLRRMNYWSDRMFVYVDHMNAPGWRASCRLGWSQDTLAMIDGFNRLWNQRPKNAKPLKVGVDLVNLASDASVGSPLFPADAHRVKLSLAVDKINQKMGGNYVWYGAMHDGFHDARLTAPTRISFTVVPDMEKDFGIAHSDLKRLIKPPVSADEIETAYP